jgi:hypothetical protein
MFEAIYWALQAAAHELGLLTSESSVESTSSTLTTKLSTSAKQVPEPIAYSTVSTLIGRITSLSAGTASLVSPFA